MCFNFPISSTFAKKYSKFTSFYQTSAASPVLLLSFQIEIQLCENHRFIDTQQQICAYIKQPHCNKPTTIHRNRSSRNSSNTTSFNCVHSHSLTHLKNFNISDEINNYMHCIRKIEPNNSEQLSSHVFLFFFSGYLMNCRLYSFQL